MKYKSKLEMRNGYVAASHQKEEQSKSGIIIPDTTELDDRDEITVCTIEFATNGSEYKVGDKILYSKMIPENLYVEDSEGNQQELWLVKETDIKAVIK